MRRWMSIVAYGLGGFLLAVTMVWAGFAVAGQRLSAPANPIEPVAVPSSATPSATHTPNASPSRADDHAATPSPASVGTSSARPAATPEPDRSGSSPTDDSPHDSGKGDD